MLKVSITVPVPAAGLSLQLDAGTIDPATLIASLSQTLSPSDSFAVYGTLDPSSTAASSNLTLICQIEGSYGLASIAPEVYGWRYFFVQRLLGNGAGSFYVSGETNRNPLSAPASVALPAAGAAFALLPLTALKNSVLIALDASQTVHDVFNVYGTDDPSAMGKAGTILIGQLRGGGTAQPVGSFGSVHVDSFESVLIERVSGATPGFAYAWGRSDQPCYPLWNVRNVTAADSPVLAAIRDYIRADTTGGDITVVIQATSGGDTRVAKISPDGHTVLPTASIGVINGPAVSFVQWSVFAFTGVGSSVDVVS